MRSESIPPAWLPFQRAARLSTAARASCLGMGAAHGTAGGSRACNFSFHVRWLGWAAAVSGGLEWPRGWSAVEASREYCTSTIFSRCCAGLAGIFSPFFFWMEGFLLESCALVWASCTSRHDTVRTIWHDFPPTKEGDISKDDWLMAVSNGQMLHWHLMLSATRV